MNSKSFLVASCCVGALLLSGCAVTPSPMTEAERGTLVAETRSQLRNEGERKLTGLSLSEAVARAVVNNHDFKSQRLVAALESKQLDMANWAMMPEILATAGYKMRNPENLTTSRAADGTVSTNSSLSEEKYRRLADLNFSWNVLDFGMSYYRAQQQADKYLQAKERDRRIRHQIVQETITAWYRAEAAERLRKNVDPLMTRVKRALESSKASETSRTETPLVALNYQRELLDMLQTLDALKKELTGADHVLAAVIGSDPGVPVSTGKADLSLSRPNVSRAELERIALNRRPDVRSALYQSRITEHEARIALMSLLPVPTVQFGPGYDSNSYLVHNQWFGLSTQIAQSLMKPLRYGDTVKGNELRAELDREQTLAITAASLLQVHLADLQLRVAQESLATAESQLDVARRIHKQVRDATAAQQQPEINLIREDLNPHRPSSHRRRRSGGSKRSCRCSQAHRS